MGRAKGMQVVTANVTCWRSFKNWFQASLEQLRKYILMLQEIKLVAEQVVEAQA